MRRIKAFGFISDGFRMRGRIGLFALLLAALFVMGLSGTAEAFEDAEVRIETNSTDGDSGLQLFFDGEPWKRTIVRGPDGRIVFWVTNLGKLRRFGTTENFMESNEPNYEEEMTLPEILEFLPAGEYKFHGRTVDNEKLFATATLTHDLPCGPVVTSPVSPDPEEDPELDPSMPVISWEAVVNKIDTESDFGECDEADFDITVTGYEVVVENESTDPTETFTIKLPAGVLQVTLPPEFVIPGDDYKFEILAIEESGNQTITESNFTAIE